MAMVGGPRFSISGCALAQQKLWRRTIEAHSIESLVGRIARGKILEAGCNCFQFLPRVILKRDLPVLLDGKEKEGKSYAISEWTEEQTEVETLRGYFFQSVPFPHFCHGKSICEKKDSEELIVLPKGAWVDLSFLQGKDISLSTNMKREIEALLKKLDDMEEDSSTTERSLENCKSDIAKEKEILKNLALVFAQAKKVYDIATQLFSGMDKAVMNEYRLSFPSSNVTKLEDLGKELLDKVLDSVKEDLYEVKSGEKKSLKEMRMKLEKIILETSPFLQKIYRSFKNEKMYKQIQVQYETPEKLFFSNLLKRLRSRENYREKWNKADSEEKKNIFTITLNALKKSQELFFSKEREGSSKIPRSFASDSHRGRCDDVFSHHYGPRRRHEARRGHRNPY